jgi:lipoate-protein ligase A
VADTWRFIAEDGVTASFGLAADEWMASRTEGPPCLRLYTYRSHCVLIGRHQRLGAEVQLENCAAHGISFNRRPTGGGTILMGADQLGLALTVPAARRGEFPRETRELFQRMASGLLQALRALGIAAEFHRKNDLEVEGRKIAGLGLYAAPRGGLLFHASLVVDMDIPLMLRVLKTPFEKLADKAVSSVADRMTTVRREVGFPISVDAVRRRVQQGYAGTFEVTWTQTPLTPAEREAMAELERRKYLTSEWVDQRGIPLEAGGDGRVKTAGGLIEAHVSLRGSVIMACCITGDFFAGEGQVARLERRLRRVAAEAQALQQAIADLCAEGWGLDGVPAAAVAEAVLAAVNDARRRERDGQPYGCFVNP